ncbi:MAG: urease accessory protein UreF [Curvibacter sp.]|nr:urease accessory protein UreF [Curvibacter sp.]
MTTSPALPSPGLLQLIWLASPALPVGGFSYSEGLEAAIEWAGVRDEASVGDWIADQLHLGLARGELAALAAAVRALREQAPDRLRPLNDWLLQTRETAELRLQCEQMGHSLAEWLRKLRPADAVCLDGLSPCAYPVAFAAAAHGSQASEADICGAYAFGWAENMTQAAIKAVPLGQSAGQRILARLMQDIVQAVATALALDESERQAFTPGLAVLSARHETQYSRLFRS